MTTLKIASLMVCVLLSFSRFGFAQVKTWTSVGIKSFSVSPDSVFGGRPFGVYITLDRPLAGTQSFRVVSDHPAVIPSPLTGTFGSGTSEKAFNHISNGVAAATTVTLTFEIAGTTARTTVTVKPGELNSIAKVGGAAIHGGGTTEFLVSLIGNAPAGGAPILLSTTHPMLVKVPGFVKVPQDRQSVNFPVEIGGVDSKVNATVTASYGGISKSLPLELNPPRVQSIQLSPSSIAGGTPVVGKVLLSGTAPPAGWTLHVSSDNDAADVPAWLQVPAGLREAQFGITTKPVLATTNLNITAGVARATQSSAVLTVASPTLQALAVNPSTASYQAGTVDGVLTLSTPAAAGTSVPLSWSSTQAASAPSNVEVAAGQKTAAFKITLKPVTQPTPFTLSAFFGGTRKTVTLTVTP